jgi:hypothetical protein
MKMIHKILSLVLAIGLLFSALTTRVNAQSQSIDTSKNAANLDEQIQKDEASPNPDLQTLLRQYYYYQHAYNDRAGVSGPVWMLTAIFWEPAKKTAGIAVNLVNTFQMETMLEKWWNLKDSVTEVKNLVLKGDLEGAAVLTALNLPDEKFPIPVASLFLGIGKNEFLKWRADTLYQEILKKLDEENPNYCVYTEVVNGKEHCYKSWLEYRNAFQPKESIFFEGKLPRSVKETEQAEKLWQEMVKYGEFSNGQMYTVSELTGENWQNTFKDVGWAKRPSQTKTITTPTITFQGEAVRATNTKVYIKDTLLLDVESEEPGCSSIGEILYSPANDYFLVIISCFEGDNQLYLFRLDGSGKKKITEKWDVVNYSEVEWAKDGKSFVYHRINSCCVAPSEVGESGPAVGMVRYDVATGVKTFLADSCGNSQCEANVGESPKTCPRDCQGKASPQTETQSLQPSPSPFPSVRTPSPSISSHKQVTLDPNPPFLLYPGAVTAGGRSNIPNTVMSPNPDEPASVFVQAYAVRNVSGQEILRWYKEQFAEAGWQVKKHPGMAGDSDFIFQKGDSKTEWVWVSVLDREYWNTIAMNGERNLAPDETGFRLFWR